MKTVQSNVFPLAALLAALAVVLGAFGAHALEDMLHASGRTAVWETAVLYHLVHAVAILALMGPAAAGCLPAAHRIAWLWVISIALFSGSLYALSLGGPAFVGPITPLGGLGFIAGWLWAALQLWSSMRRQG